MSTRAKIWGNVGLWVLGLLAGAAVGGLIGLLLANTCRSADLSCLGYLVGGPIYGTVGGVLLVALASWRLRRGLAWVALSAGLAIVFLLAPLPFWASGVAAAVAAPALATYLLVGRRRLWVGLGAAVVLVGLSFGSSWLGHLAELDRVRASAPQVIVVDATVTGPAIVYPDHLQYSIRTADGLAGSVDMRASADVTPIGTQLGDDLWARTTTMNGQPEQLITVRRGHLTAVVTLQTPDADRAIALASSARLAETAEVVPYDPARRP